MNEELLTILEHCLWYGHIHTVKGVQYEYTHKEILDKLENYLKNNYEIVNSENGNYRIPKP